MRRPAELARMRGTSDCGPRSTSAISPAHFSSSKRDGPAPFSNRSPRGATRAACPPTFGRQSPGRVPRKRRQRPHTEMPERPLYRSAHSYRQGDLTSLAGVPSVAQSEAITCLDDGRASALVTPVTGVMDSPANIDGVMFFMDEIWPRITAVRPAAEAVIVGRSPAPTLREAARARRLNWTFTGFVDDIRPHVAAADISVIPLRVGSGTRIKAFESMAMGRPVVATTIGIEGLDIRPDEHYLRADTPVQFAAAILRLLDDEGLRTRLRQAARARMEAHFGWDRIARLFEAVCVRAMQMASS